MKKMISFYFRLAGVILIVSGLAKLPSFLGKTKIFFVPDPVFNVQTRYLLIAAGLVELVVATICFLKINPLHKARLLLWLSSSFCFYRFSLYLLDYKKPCPCMGSLTALLEIRPETADIAMKIVLAYLFVGSLAILIQFRKTAQAQKGAPH
jgi:hypothetical protein